MSYPSETFFSAIRLLEWMGLSECTFDIDRLYETVDFGEEGVVYKTREPHTSTGFIGQVGNVIMFRKLKPEARESDD